MKLRFWILLIAFVTELGAIYSIQSYNRVINIAVCFNCYEGTHAKIGPTIEENPSDFVLPELLEEKEIKETDNTEDNPFSSGLPQYFDLSGIEYFSSFNLPSSESGPAYGHPCPLFVRYHCWKLHLI